MNEPSRRFWVSTVCLDVHLDVWWIWHGMAGRVVEGVGKAEMRKSKPCLAKMEFVMGLSRDHELVAAVQLSWC